MAQHTLLIAVAAPLIVLGRPVLVSLWALPRATRRRLTNLAVVRGCARAAQPRPVAAFALHATALWAWHLPALYQASLTNDLVHALQHASFLLTALLFWAAFLNVRERSRSYGAGVLYTFATAAHTSILGALITLAPVAWYARYAETAHAWGLTPLEDQQLAGLIMWVPGGLLYTVLALALLAAWLREAEQRRVPRRLAAASLLVLLLAAGGCDVAPRIARDALDARTAAGLTGGAPDVGKLYVERFGCGGCHEIDGVLGADGLVGPPLNGIARRMYIAGILTNTPENMARWIHDPQVVDSLTAMPRLGATMEQARDITAYLYTLK
jgi:cytochrome c2